METVDPIKFFFAEVFPTIQKNSTTWGWPQVVSESDVKPTHLTALSNMTFKVDYLPDGVTYEPILAKKFGHGLLEKLIDRSVDNKVSSLFGEKGIGPQVLYYDDSFRIEKFLVSEGFTSQDMNDPIQRRKLMYYIQKLHRVSCPVVPNKTQF